jgi:twitching motility protein PilJ
MADTRNAALLGVREYSLLAIAGTLILVSLGAFYLSQQGGGGGEASPGLRFGQAVEGISRAAQDVSRGVAPDFAAIGEQLKSAEADLQEMRNASPTAQADVAALTESWKPLREAAGGIVSGEPQYKRAAANAALLASAAPPLSAGYEQIADRLASKGAPSGQIFLIASQLIRIERMLGASAKVLGSSAPQAAADSLNREAQTFARNNRVLTEPVPGLDYTPVRDATVETIAKQISVDFAPALKASADLLEDSPTLARLQAAAASVKSALPAVTAAQRKLMQSHELSAPATGSPTLLPVVYGAGGLALLFLISFGMLASSAVRRREKLVEDKESSQQQAILGLLDEITNLANGDLTVDVTVTEDFTGAIADSINYTVQTLRGLVGTINQTSEEIVGSASSTQDTAVRMSQASDRQAREIAAAANSITATSGQLQEVAARAERIAVQAQTSVQIAHGGAGTVGRTIQSMAALREQIQDTAKRIKRLGESSQEIGNITELINDIAEQTNTLALNASIQAAMAGDAGRGFAVVADEVQRLAERATSATRQIENLVKTIQADTTEAIISMERSTANVVSGAKSAEEAGQSLTKIEAASQELSGLIQNISGAARDQSTQTTIIAKTMQAIREITIQTANSADRTAQAVGELNVLSDKLRESVAGFKLPDAA